MTGEHYDGATQVEISEAALQKRLEGETPEKSIEQLRAETAVLREALRECEQHLMTLRGTRVRRRLRRRVQAALAPQPAEPAGGEAKAVGVHCGNGHALSAKYLGRLCPVCHPEPRPAKAGPIKLPVRVLDRAQWRTPQSRVDLVDASGSLVAGSVTPEAAQRIASVLNAEGRTDADRIVWDHSFTPQQLEGWRAQCDQWMDEEAGALNAGAPPPAIRDMIENQRPLDADVRMAIGNPLDIAVSGEPPAAGEERLEKLRRLAAEVSRLNVMADQLRMERDECRTARNEAQDMAGRWIDKHDALHQQLAEARAQIERDGQAVRELHAELDRRQQQLAEKTAEAETWRAHCERARDYVDELKQQLSCLQPTPAAPASADGEWEKGYEQAVREVLLHLRAYAFVEAHKSVYDQFAARAKAPSHD